MTLTSESIDLDHRTATVWSVEDVAAAVRGFVAEPLSAVDELTMLVVSEASVAAVTDVVVDQLETTIIAPSERVFTGSCRDMFVLYDDAIQQAIAMGYGRIRIVGQPTWYSSGVADDWYWFERATNVLFDGWPIAALCLMDGAAPARLRAAFDSAHPRLADGSRNASFSIG